MSNVKNSYIQIKRGKGKPWNSTTNSSLLAPYELGFDVDSKILYVGEDNTSIEPRPVLSPIIAKKNSESLPSTLYPGQLLIVYEETN